jgi:hypothetical protein
MQTFLVPEHGTFHARRGIKIKKKAFSGSGQNRFQPPETENPLLGKRVLNN